MGNALLHIPIYSQASRRGLYLETELALLMEEKKIEHHEYTAIYVTLEELLFSSSGLLNFSNRDVRKAVENRYLSTAEKRKEVHSQLAAFFQVFSLLLFPWAHAFPRL